VTAAGGNIQELDPSGDRHAPSRTSYALVLSGFQPDQTLQLHPSIAGSIDRTWQFASKTYDLPRSEILERVDRQASSGPFRADWESLATYRVPSWYEDAKFGIFIHWGALLCSCIWQ